MKIHFYICKKQRGNGEKMKTIVKYSSGIVVTFLLAQLALFISNLMPLHLISGGVFALLIGMAFSPIVSNYQVLSSGIKLVSKEVLRLSIILMGLTLSFEQVLQVGGYSLIVMTFTLLTAFGFGYVIGKAFHMNWKLSSLISAGTGICGGSAIAAIAPTIGAKNKDIAYAISATFLFDVVMVVLFPIAGRYFGMSDMGFGLWAGTAVNDTSSVVAAAYAFSDAAGQYAVVVKLTRTLSIIPIVLIFSLINRRVEEKLNHDKTNQEYKKVKLKSIFPYFILMFLVMVTIKSTGFISDSVSTCASDISKLFMVMALGAIGLKTNFKEVINSGFKPMLHGFIISALVVIVSFVVQMALGQL